MTTPILRGTDLLKRFPGRGRAAPVVAVDGVSLELREGECLALVGESGCGKSTLASLLLALTAPDHGTVHFRGTDLSTIGRTELRSMRRHFQPVFQNGRGSLDPGQRIGSAVAEGVEIHHGRVSGIEAIVAERLIEVGLDPAIADRFPHEISGGQAQRVALARAIAVEPQVLVCDETFSGLDGFTQLQIMDLLSSLGRNRHMAMLVISHDLALVRLMADRIAVMHRGRIVEEGTADQVIGNPRAPETVRLLAAVPRWPL